MGISISQISITQINIISHLVIIQRSSDGGVTVHNSDDEFNEIMIKSMEMLNLKPHICGVNPRKTKLLCAAADIEGHLGTDNKVD
jgi:hypothetical protein